MTSVFFMPCIPEEPTTPSIGACSTGIQLQSQRTPLQALRDAAALALSSGTSTGGTSSFSLPAAHAAALYQAVWKHAKDLVEEVMRAASADSADSANPSSRWPEWSVEWGVQVLPAESAPTWRKLRAALREAAAAAKSHWGATSEYVVVLTADLSRPPSRLPLPTVAFGAVLHEKEPAGADVVGGIVWLEDDESDDDDD